MSDDNNKQMDLDQRQNQTEPIQATLLQKAIIINHLQLVKEIITQLPVEQLKRELIRNQFELLSATSLALFFDRTRRIATFILRFVVAPEKMDEDTVLSWFELFEHTEKMYRHFRSHLTATRMARELLGLRPYIKSGEFTLNELVSRPKFFKAAWMIGAEYKPEFLGDTFASHMYWDRSISRPEKRKLFDWMWSVGMYQTNPFQIEIQAALLAEGQKSRAKNLMTLPNEKPCDERGYNLFHWAAYIGKLSFWRSRNHCRINLGYSKTHVIEMLLHKNMHGVTPLSLCLIKFANAKYILFPKEVRYAIREVVDRDDLSLIEHVFNSHLIDTCKPLFFYLYSLGVTSDKFLKAFGDKYHNPFDEPVTTYTNYQPTNDEKMEMHYDPTASGFSELPPEIIYEIALSLNVEEVFSLFTVSKKMTKLLRQPNEVFWSKHHSLHFPPLDAPCPSFKQRALYEFRGRKNWQSNKYHDLVLKRHELSVMDDNWIIVSTNNKWEWIDHITPLVSSYYYFNCHTQQILPGILNTKDAVYPTLILSNYNYDTRGGPAYFGDCYKDEYYIVRGQELSDCKAVKEFMDGRPEMPHFYVNYKLIDHRMFISERSAIYDPEHDKIIGQLATQRKFDQLSRYNTYLPYSKQIYRITATEVEFYDLNYKRVNTVPMSLPYLSGIPKQIDEHTLFVRRNDQFSKPGFIDMRMNQFVEFLSDHIKPGLISSAVSLNSERIVFTHPMLQIITSWNLRSRRWEFVDDDWFFPNDCNLRYMVGSYGDSVVIRDFCTNAIKY